MVAEGQTDKVEYRDAMDASKNEMCISIDITFEMNRAVFQVNLRGENEKGRAS